MCISYRYYIDILFKCIFLIATLIIFTLFLFSSRLNVAYIYIFLHCIYDMRAILRDFFHFYHIFIV